MNINETIQSALNNYQAGNIQQAANILSAILETNSTCIDAWQLLGIICLQLQNYDLAIDCFKEILGLEPQNVRIIYDLATAFHEKGDLNEAIVCYQKILELNPDEKNARTNLIKLEHHLEHQGQKSILKMSIGERIKQKYNLKNWDRIEKERQKLLSHCKPIAPFSLIRLGDGELKILRIQNQLSELLATAIKHADLIGLPDDYDENKKNHVMNWDQQICECLKNSYAFQINEDKLFNTYVFLYIPEIIGEFVNKKKVLWITANAETILNNLKHEKFRSYYNLHDIVKSSFVEIPESMGNLPSEDYSTVLSHVRKCLSEKQDYDIALIGGGALGKIYCHIIKTEYGKQAFDIGCLMSAYKGLRNRVVFRNWGDLDFLVWQN
jgi:tetratricopeptide (TPR) repeat protein